VISESLAMLAEQALLEGNWDLFMERVAHLSTVAPESSALQTLLAKFEVKRQRLDQSRRATLYSVLSLTALVGLSEILYPAWIQERFEPAHREVAQSYVPPVWKAKVSHAEAAVQALPPAQSLPKPQGRARSVTKADRVVKPTGVVRFDVPSGVEVYWDQKKVDPKKELKAQHDGLHEMRLVKPGSAPIVQRIDVSSTEPTVIRVHLE
jgi:hypothetical protein